MGKIGGARPGAGRPKGAMQKITTIAREEAMASGLLPHEFLLLVARGEPIMHRSFKIIYDDDGVEVSRETVEEEYYPDFPTRIDAAKAAAPFYAPKLVAQTVAVSGISSDVVVKTLQDIAVKLPV